jgi:hypothetical protein
LTLSLTDAASRALSSPVSLGPRFRLTPLVLVAWAAVAAASLFSGPRILDAMSTDDLMRLAEVRDWLGGQGWFDLTQYRLAPPAGLAMHWSRIVDLPIATLILALTPVLGRASAEIATAAIWPLLLLMPTLVLAGALARRLSNAQAILPTILLVAVAAPALVHFRPGGLDHHGFQLMLMAATIYGASEEGDTYFVPALGGFAAAVSIAIGLEMAPALAAILAAVGLRWAIEGKPVANLTSGFGLAFGAGTAILFAATVPVSSWNVAMCDRISLPCVAAAGLAGGGLALLASNSNRLNNFFARLAVGGIAGGIVIGIMGAAFHVCLGDPHGAVEARAAAIWLANVTEAQNIFEIARNEPSDVLHIYGPPLAAIVLGALAILRTRKEERTIWIAPFLALIALSAEAMWEVRGAASANLVAQPLLVASLIRLFDVRASWLARHGAIVALLLISSPVLVLAGKAVGKSVRFFDPARPIYYASGPLACRKFEDIAPLARLEPGRVISYIDVGPAILVGSRHSIFAAPYDSNLQGNEIAFNVLLGDDATARHALVEHQVDYVAICPGSPERINFQRGAPEGLSERLARGEVPSYLEPVAGDPAAPLKVFRVR